MGVILDHVLICSAVGAPEAEALIEAGLREGSRNTHAGQGTANRRFFFEDNYLELIWVADPQEAQSEKALPTRLWSRWSGRGVQCCPFGIALRSDDGGAPPFAIWNYYPDWLPGGLCLSIAEGVPLHEPEIFHLGFAKGPTWSSQEPADHRIPVRSIQKIGVELPGNHPRSPASLEVERAGVVSFETSRRWFLEIVFDETGRQTLDFSPRLPLSFRF